MWSIPVEPREERTKIKEEIYNLSNDSPVKPHLAEKSAENDFYSGGAFLIPLLERPYRSFSD